MIEYRIHGRGGQGNVAAAYLLAATAFEAGWSCQAFPAFGAERRGAPVAAFVRIDTAPIQLRSQIRTPDILIVQDDTLLHDPKITAGLRPGGSMLVNSVLSGEEISQKFKCRAICIDATNMALAHIGRPIPNTALLAALLALTAQFPLSALSTALKKRFHGEVLAMNIDLIGHAAKAVPEGVWAKEPTDA
jgi:pyruvate ferredoxin oxidoreductase gamma subunit